MNTMVFMAMTEALGVCAEYSQCWEYSKAGGGVFENDMAKNFKTYVYILVSASLSPREAAHTSAHECFHQALGRRASMLGGNEEDSALRYEREYCRKYLGGSCGD